MKELRRTVVIIAAGLAVSCGGDNGSASGDSTRDAEGSSAEERCFELWNGGEEHIGRQVAKGFAQQTTVYATVGFDATFPDRCLVTVAAPDFNSAQQCRESSGSEGGLGPWSPAADGDVAGPPDSVKQWNAAVDESGALTPGSSW